MDLTIHPMTPEDTDGKGYVHWKSWQETYQGLVDAGYLSRLTPEKFQEIARRWPENTLVAVLDDRIVGFSIATAEAQQEANAVKVEADKKIAEQNTELAVQQAEMQVRADTKKAASPLAQTDKIVMYGDGNSTRLIRDVISDANQVVDGMKESTGIDLAALLAGFTGGKLAQKEE